MVIAPQCFLAHINWQYPEVTDTRTDLHRDHKKLSSKQAGKTCTRHPLRKA
jgi:hypothetical protein